MSGPGAQEALPAYRIFDFADETAWKQGRLRGIGGSDAAAIVGMSPYKTNVRLFEELTGRREPEDISGKECVIYGHAAEGLIRNLFSLDYPGYQVEHYDWRILQSRPWPFLQASLDGEIMDASGRRGVLEIKTAEIFGRRHREKWEGRIPDHYYIQALHYLLVTGYDFAVLRARLVSRRDGIVQAREEDYFVERAEVEEDLKYLLSAEEKFWSYVEAGRYPPQALPEL